MSAAKSPLRMVRAALRSAAGSGGANGDRGRADVVGGSDPHSRPLGQEGPGLVRLVEGAANDDRIALGDEALGQPARGRELGLLGEALADQREFEEDDRAGVHPGQPGPGAAASGGRESDGWPAIASRHGADAQGSPA